MQGNVPPEVKQRIVALLSQYQREGMKPRECKAALAEAGIELTQDQFRYWLRKVRSNQTQSGDLTRAEDARAALATLLSRLYNLLNMYIGQAMVDPSLSKGLSDLLGRFYEGLKTLHPVEKQSAVYTLQAVQSSDQTKRRLLGQVKRLMSTRTGLGLSALPQSVHDEVDEVREDEG